LAGEHFQDVGVVFPESYQINSCEVD